MFFSDLGESGTGVSSDEVLLASRTSKISLFGASALRARGLFLRFGDWKLKSGGKVRFSTKIKSIIFTWDRSLTSFRGTLLAMAVADFDRFSSCSMIVV